MKTTAGLTIALTVILATNVFGGSLRVELDGSGDYVGIQEAVNAAASGDTILIGPGRWDQMYTYTIPAGGWTDQVIVAVDNKDLTLVGSGQGVTIIGPEVAPPFGNPGPIAIVGGTDHDLTVKSMTIENMRNGIYEWGKTLQVEDVHIRDCYLGSSPWATHGAEYVGCLFERCYERGIAAGSRASGMIIRNCEFIGWAQKHISLQGVEDILIEHCDFYTGNISVQFEGSSSYGVVQDCVFHSGYGPHIVATTYSHMTLNRCRMFGGIEQLHLVDYSVVTGEENEFLGTNLEGGGFGTIVAQMASLDLHDSHIYKGNAEYTVRFYDYPFFPNMGQHLENNYWGTSDSDSIAAWIYNEDDDSSLNIQTFIEPFYDHPIPNEPASMSDLKKMFR